MVSVVIPTYNRSKTIARAIESVLVQDYPKIEIIVVDDCSEDGTIEVLTGYSQKIRRVCLPTHSGACAARNAGIVIARGEYITFLDSDDEYLPGKIEKQVELLKMRPEIGVVTCGRIDSRNGKDYQSWVPHQKKDIVKRLLEKREGIGAGTPFLMVRKEVLEENNILFDNRMPASQDWDFLIRVAAASKFDFVPEALVKVHHHEGDRVYDHLSALEAMAIQFEKYSDWFDKYGASRSRFTKKFVLLAFICRQNRKGLDFLDSEWGGASYEHLILSGFLKYFSYRSLFGKILYRLIKSS